MRHEWIVSTHRCSIRDVSCTVSDCAGRIIAKGFCDTHYRRFRKWGDPLGSAPKKQVRTCEVDGCDRKHYAHGLCDMHRHRMKVFGTVDWCRPTPVEKFWANVQKGDTATSCWLWTGTTIGAYGYLRRSEGDGSTGAHRFSYELHVGPIPEGHVIDHICRVPLCVNPTHLRPMTIGENVLIGVGPSATAKRRQACNYGHSYSGDNLRVLADGSRRCRECERRNARTAYWRKKDRRRARTEKAA